MDNTYIIHTLLHSDDPELLEEMAPEQESTILEARVEEAEIQPVLRLDYKLKTCEERADLVNKIVAQTPAAQLTHRYLEILGDYIMGGLTKAEKKDHLYLTENRMITVGKRETSFEGLAEKFENGEDGIYNLITEDKNILFVTKNTITDEDIARVPGLRELREEIARVEEAQKAATGRNKYLLMKQLIEMRKDQYILKNSYYAPLFITASPRSIARIDLSERRWVDKNGEPHSEGLISFFNPSHIAAILTHYNALKIETAGRYNNDFFYLMEDFDKLFNKALNDYPMYRDIVVMKRDGVSNLDIQARIERDYGKTHTVQHISAIWCQKVPKIIAEQAQNDYLLQYYADKEDAKWKRCSCCHELKLASPRFFARNNTSKDGFYSQCKKCRNKKTVQVKLR